MKPQHTALLGLPDELRRYGLNVVALDGWDTAQNAYLWTDRDGNRSYNTPPSGYMIHGSAGTRSVPVVRNRFGRWSSGNAWAGLDNGNGVLTTKPVPGSINRPTIYLTAAGPARWSAGYGYWPVMQQILNDIRPPLDAEGRDGIRAANRHLFSIENTHPNDGTLIDPDVYDHLVGLGVVLHNMFGWTERTVGHRSWTRRKPVDPWFIPGGLTAIQDDIQTVLKGQTMPTTFKIGTQNAAWEPQIWRLYELLGGVIDANKDSSQIATLMPWKADPPVGVKAVRRVDSQDFDVLGRFIGLTDTNVAKLKTVGLYSFGKELAALRERAYRRSGERRVGKGGRSGWSP